MTYQQYPPPDPRQPHPQPPPQPQAAQPWGAQPPYQQHPPQWVPPRPPRRPRTGLWISLAVVGTLFTGCVALVASVDDGAGGAGTGAAAPPSAEAGGAGAEKSAGTGKKKVAAGIGDVVKDGQFTFTVTKTRRAEVLGENPYLQEEAQGEFVIFNVTVRNHGDEPRDFHSSSQELFVGGKEYEAAPDLEGKAFLNTINPGNTVKGRLAFDVPEKAKPTRLILHDSPFSEGAVVTLSE